MKNVKVGVIGVGNMGSAHAFQIMSGQIDGMTLSALCDTNKDTERLCREKFENVPFYDNHMELLEKSDAEMVIICAPHYYHPKIAIDAFNASKHVLTEKPAGVQVSKVTEMNNAAEKSGKKFGIVFNQRTDFLFSKAREIFHSGDLGELLRAVWIVTNWYRTQEYYDSSDWRATWRGEGGGVLINQAPHNLDLLQWICGMPCSLTAFCDVAKFHDIEVEDDATIFARYENGATATFITSTGEKFGANRFEMSFAKGKIVLEDSKLKVWKETRGDTTCYDEITYTDEKKQISGHNVILENFAKSILHDVPLIAPGAEGVNELMISNAAYLSSWTGEIINIPFDSKRFDEILNKKIEKSKKTGKSNSRYHDKYLDRWQVKW